MRTLPLALVLAILPLVAASATVQAQSPSPTPQVTSDVVVVTDKDSYVFGETATVSLRNDGSIPYRVPLQLGCNLSYKDAATERSIIVVGHCDLVGDADPLEPGGTVDALINWRLTECVEPGFFCTLFRPLPSSQYTISGSLVSVDGTSRSNFTKTVSITGPEFTSDVKVVLSRATSNPNAVAIQVRNDSTREYLTRNMDGCWLRFYRPDGFRFDVSGAACDFDDTVTVSPGATVTVISAWNLDECDQQVVPYCSQSVPLAPGDYTVRASMYSVDNQAYSESSAVQTVPLPAQITASPTPTSVRTPAIFPELGGPPVGGGSSLTDVVAALVVAGGLLALATYLAARNRRGAYL
jgi:hypothetical protein